MIDLVDRKYRVYYNNSSCKVYNGDHIYALNMCSTMIPIEIEKGGSISLPNGDTLLINERMGWVDSDTRGIGLSLASGHEFIIWYYMAKLDRWQESGFGCIYDFDENDMYAEGNYMRIYYNLGGGSVYDSPYSSLWESERFGYDNNIPFITLVIHDGMWTVVDNNPLYEGNTVTLNSGEKIWVSNRWGSQYYGSSIICFSRDSGYGCFAYLKYNSNTINQTGSFWLGLDCPLDNNTSITIYDYGNTDYENAIHQSYDYSEENVSQYLGKLCVLRYNLSTSSWYVEEDYS